MRAVVGDWMVCWGDVRPSRGRAGDAAFTEAFRSPSSVLWVTAPTDGWSGAPWRRVDREDGTAWIHGEAGRDEADLARRVAGDDWGDAPGHFLVISWRAANDTWTVVTNRFGTLHAYHGLATGGAAVGSSCRAVGAVASAGRLDWEALTGFCHSGFFPGDRTQLEDVRILRPAHRHGFGPDGRPTGADRTWTWPEAPREDWTTEDAADAAHAALTRVLARQLGSSHPVGLPLSGGLDSRWTLGAAPRDLPADALWAYSYGYGDDSPETRIARQLAALRGLPIETLQVTPYLGRELDTVAAALEGFQDLTHARQAVVRRELGSHARRVLCAHWGDVFCDGRRPRSSEAPEPLEERVRAATTMPGGAWLLEHLCAPHVDTEAVISANIEREARRVRAVADPDLRWTAYKTETWSFRWTTASLRMHQAAAYPRLPFYEPELADVLLSIPGRLHAGRRVQIAALRRHARDLAAVVWEPHHANLFRYRTSWSARLPGRAWRKVWRWVRRRRIIERNWEVQLMGEVGRAVLEDHLLRPGLGIHELVPRPRTRALVEASMQAPDRARGRTVSMLLTLSVWLEGR